MKPSLLSAAAGLMAGALTEMFVFAPFEAGSRISWWLGYVVIALLYGAPLVAAVWLFVLWPLYVRVPVTSILWSPVVCISAGVVAGCALYFISLWLIFRFPSAVLLSFQHLLISMVVGGVACTVACYFKHSEQPRPSSNQTLQPTAGRSDA